MNQAITTAFFQDQGLPAPRYEYPHIPGRRFRLDIAWPDSKVGIECNGGIYKKLPSHSSMMKILRDMEKDNLGLLHGWRVLKVTPQTLHATETANFVKTLINGH